MPRILITLIPLFLAADWPRFLGPNGDGTTTEKNLIGQWPKNGPPEVWTRTLGNGYAPPTVAAGRLFHFDRYGDKNRLTCRDANTGAEKWTAEYVTDYVDQYGFDTGPRCCPVVGGETVIVYGPEGMLVAYGVADGKEKWRIDTLKEYRVVPNFFGVASTPWVEGETVLVAVGGSPRGRPADFSMVRPDGSCIVAFDLKTGRELWKTGEELASYASPMVVEMNRQRVGLYFARGGLFAFNPQTGATLFKHPWRARILESVNAANPVVMGDKIFISESYERGSSCLKWDGQSLSEIWNDKDKDRFDVSLMAHWCTPIRHEGFVYGSSSRHSADADLRCVDIATGEVKWTVRRTRWLTLAKVNDLFIALTEAGEVRIFKPNPGKYEQVAQWDADLAHPAWAPPVIADGRLYLRGKGKLVCYDLRAK